MQISGNIITTSLYTYVQGIHNDFIIIVIFRKLIRILRIIIFFIYIVLNYVKLEYGKFKD